MEDCVIVLGHWLGNKSAETRHMKNGGNAEAKRKKLKKHYVLYKTSNSSLSETKEYYRTLVYLRSNPDST